MLCFMVKKLFLRRSATSRSYGGAPKSTSGVFPEGTKSISVNPNSAYGPFAAWLSEAIFD